ncbi:MAG: enoyl-CoA hydratase/isomerase family protein, partial [Alphaproteobacteria bacterium]
MTQEVLFERRGHLGLITLNRPKALNSLTHEMALAMTDQLTQWQGDDAIAVVAVVGAGEKGFCAGGDIRALYESGQSDKVYSRAFYRDEYILDRLIKHYPKPYVAILDGIVMGGGVGISVHGSHRVATDRTTFAMPETGIGLFPDVGGSFFLPRLEGRLGMYLGLTGRRLKGADAFHAGVATHYAAQADEEAIIEALAALSPADEVGEVLDSFHADAGTASFVAEM